MLATPTYIIRLASPADAPSLRRLAYLDEQSPLTGRILIGEIDAVAAAAISIDERRIVADPFQDCGGLRAHLRLRAAAVTAHERMPSLGDRVRAALQGRRLAAA